MNRLRFSHWLGIAVACLPIPFAVQDAIKMRLWDEPLWAAFAVLYTVALGAVLFSLVQGGAWVFRRLARR